MCGGAGVSPKVRGEGGHEESEDVQDKQLPYLINSKQTFFRNFHNNHWLCSKANS